MNSAQNLFASPRLCRLLRVAFALGLLALQISTARALPVYSRQYGVGCQMCHTVTPRLNRFGYAFQANYFNWPDRSGPPKIDPTRYLPLSTLTTFSYQSDFTNRQDTLNFRAFELFFSSGFSSQQSPPGRAGGYFVNFLASSTSADATSGDLGDAYVALPFAGKRGQAAIVIGQATPLRYQYNPNNSLTDQIPYALDEGVGDFAFGASQPSIRLEYFDNRGNLSADGNYVTLALPLQGHLGLTRAGDIHAEDGAFAHYFHRWGYTTLGALSYVHKSGNLQGLVGTYALRRNLYLTGIATLAHSPGFNTNHVSLETEYMPSTRLALTGRAELIGGDRSEVATTGALTFYPLRTQYLRLTAEARERRADRAFNLFLRVQY